MRTEAEFQRVCKDRDEWRDRAEEMAERLDERYRAGFDDGWGAALRDMVSSMPLPVDSEGEPIRIGNVLEGDYSFLPAKVVGYHECCGDVLPIVENDGEFQVMGERVLHHCEEDVEDVLREMLEEHRRWFDGEGERTVGEMVADYAGRLQLKED